MTRILRTTLFVILAGATAAALAQDDAAALDELRNGWAAGYDAGDAAAVSELYTENARFYDASGASFEGRDAIHEHVESEIGAIAEGAAGEEVSIRIEPTTTELGDDFGFEAGTYRLVNAEGQELDGGSYLVVARRGEDGTWRIEHHMEVPMAPDPGADATDDGA